MICTTIQNRNLEQIYEALEQCEMAEIRLDRCDLFQSPSSRNMKARFR